MHKRRFVVCLLAALVLSFATTGCETMPQAVQPDFCATAKPIYIGKADSFTDETAKEILEHNLTGKNLCGWGKKEKAK